VPGSSVCRGQIADSPDRGGEWPVPRRFFIAGIRWQAECRAIPPPRGHRRAPIRRYGAGSADCVTWWSEAAIGYKLGRIMWEERTIERADKQGRVTHGPHGLTRPSRPVRAVWPWCVSLSGVPGVSCAPLRSQRTCHVLGGVCTLAPWPLVSGRGGQSRVEARRKNWASLVPGKVDMPTPVDHSSSDRRHTSPETKRPYPRRSFFSPS
jgi:hypothetical protein